MATLYDPYLPPLPPPPDEVRRWNRRRWRRSDTIFCLFVWLTLTVALIRLIETYHIPLPGR